MPYYIYIKPVSHIRIHTIHNVCMRIVFVSFSSHLEEHSISGVCTYVNAMRYEYVSAKTTLCTHILCSIVAPVRVRYFCFFLAFCVWNCERQRKLISIPSKLIVCRCPHLCVSRLVFVALFIPRNKNSFSVGVKWREKFFSLSLPNE